jgi:hypothetical protein
MREALDKLLRDLTLVTVALAIALGWSLFQFASGVSELVTTFLIEYPESAEGNLARTFGFTRPLTWTVGDRVLTFGALLAGTIELAVVVAVALFVRRRYERDDEAEVARLS